tara:strand:- start:6808 stop:7404 length:597 start_codon:yes stop_codon:yes gene_type:complete
MSAFYSWLLGLLKPVVIWWGKLHLPFTHKRVTGKHYYMLRDKITLGTVLLTTTRGEFSNLINPEKIKHAGIYVGELDRDGIKYVLEAVGRGVVKTDLVTFLTTKDLVVGIEPKFLNYDDVARVGDEAKRIIGIPYDYLFEKGSKAMYCFEAVAHIFKLLRPEIQLQCKEVVKGKQIFSYETYLNDKEKFSVVFNSNKV